MRRLTLFIILLVLAVGGCSRLIPPYRIPRDARDYVEAINTAWKEQLLSNLVRLRYGEPLTFLELTNIITQYELQRFGEAGYTFNTGALSGPDTTVTKGPFVNEAGEIISGTTSTETTTGGFSFPRHSLNIKGNLTHAMKPNLTYKPIRGENLRKALTNPIPLDTVVELLRTKHDPRLIFNYCVESINNVRNSTVGGTVLADPKFINLVNVTYDLLPLGMIRFDIESKNIDTTTVTEEPVILTTKKDGTITTQTTSKKVKTTSVEKASSCPFLYLGLGNKIDEFRGLLNLRSGLDKFPIIYGNKIPDTQTKEERQEAEAKKDKIKPKPTQFVEIVIQTRSIMQILTLLSQCISVPQIHVAENRARPSPQEAAEQTRLKFYVESSPEKPRDTFVKVKYCDYWFYIKDTNYDAKDTFSSLMTILSFTEPMTGGGPLLTIPTK